MRRGSFYIFIVLMLCMLGSCAGRQDTNEQSAVADKKEDIVEEKATNTISEIINDYIKLKDALVASNGNQSQQMAIDMLEVIDAVQMPEIQQNAKEIAATNDLSIQRTYFDSLSLNVYQMVKTAKVDMPTLYWQFCPMAFENRGAHWLSFHQEIQNPYYGDQMLTCGNVEEELK